MHFTKKLYKKTLVMLLSQRFQYLTAESSSNMQVFSQRSVDHIPLEDAESITCNFGARHDSHVWPWWRQKEDNLN